jgi:hypothetical protein
MQIRRQIAPQLATDRALSLEQIEPPKYETKKKSVIQYGVEGIIVISHLCGPLLGGTNGCARIGVVIFFIQCAIALFLHVFAIRTPRFFRAFLFGTVLQLLGCAVTVFVIIIIVVIILIIIIIVIIVVIVVVDVFAFVLMVPFGGLFGFALRGDFKTSFVRPMQKKHCHKCCKHQREKRRKRP